MSSSEMPKKPTTPPDTRAKKTQSGPHGGGVPYHQAKLGKDFVAIDPRKGHQQKLNQKDKS